MLKDVPAVLDAPAMQVYAPLNEQPYAPTTEMLAYSLAEGAALGSRRSYLLQPPSTRARLPPNCSISKSRTLAGEEYGEVGDIQ